MSTSTVTNDLQRRLGQLFETAPIGRLIAGAPEMAVGTTAGPFRSENEDRVAVARFEYPNGAMARAAIICDGIGGLLDGGEAASKAIAAFLSVVATAPREATLPNILEESVLAANRAVFDKYKGEAGTTLTAVVATSAEAWMAHVGDSRLYGFEEDTGLELLSYDDTIQGMVIMHQGGGDEDELDNRLLQYVGIGDAIKPHVVQLDMVRHRLWVLTTDGAHVVGRKTLGGIARAGRDPADFVRKLIYVAEAVGTEDNASAACLKVADLSPRREPYGGTNIIFWSPRERLEVWLPRVTVQAHNEINRSAGTTLSDIPPPPAGARPATEAPGQTKKASNKGRRKPRKTVKDKQGSSNPQMEVLFERKQLLND